MKKGYLIILISILIGGLVLVCSIMCGPIGDKPRLEKAIQAGGLIVALAAGIIALSATDPHRPKVKFCVSTSVQPGAADAKDRAALPMVLQHHYEGLGGKIRSHRLQFHLSNTSGYTLQRPVLTFRLPENRRHPYGAAGKEVRTFNSNLFNSQIELRMLEFGDTVVLSNSNLPFWNPAESLTIWFRMILDDGEFDEFVVPISVNAEAAQGTTVDVTVRPRELLIEAGHLGSQPQQG